MRARHYERVVFIPASPGQVFAFADDHSRLSSHMNESSWMMGGGRLAVEIDDSRGQGVGSHIRLNGRVFGVPLYLDQVVTRRSPPHEKVWETVGTPRLLVIGHYEMGVHVTPAEGGSQLRVFIDYDLPTAWLAYWLGWVFGPVYARWCVSQMLSGAAAHFRHPAAAAA